MRRYKTLTVIYQLESQEDQYDVCSNSCRKVICYVSLSGRGHEPGDQISLCVGFAEESCVVVI